MSKVSVRYE